MDASNRGSLIRKLCALIERDLYYIAVGKQSEKGDKDQESIQLSATPDPGYHIGE